MLTAVVLLTKMAMILLADGCVCIKEKDINMASPASYFSRTMNPEEVPTNKRLAQSCESLSQKDVNIDKVQLGDTYGPSESSVMAYCRSDVRIAPELSKIGYPAASAHWIAEQADVHRLVPTGVIGELTLGESTISTISTMLPKPLRPLSAVSTGRLK